MDVNRDNFYDVLPAVLRDINDADFVAIDGEFTGILPFNQMNYFDSPAERYKRHYDCDRHYLMVQVGLAMVRCTNAAENRYTLKAYNFYVYTVNEADAIDFTSRSSSLQFLANNGFDFAQLFLKGIPFVCKSTYLTKLKATQRAYARRAERGTPTDATADTPTASPTNGASDAELLSKNMTGFSEVMWKLQESGKPIVGHNLHMDILHIVKQFFTPIPSSYDEYKTIVKSLFPKFIDTKTVASTSIFQNIISNTALNAVYKVIREAPFPQCRFETPDNFRYDEGEHEHTAGYDAMCTAVCMTKMLAFIADKTDFKENPMEHALVASFFGKQFYMRSYDLKYSDILNDDDLPDRSGVFYVVHPPSWSTANIREFFQPWNLLSYDRHDAKTHIVGMPLLKETTETLLAKMRATDRNLIITSYAEFHRLDVSKIKTKEPNHLFDVDPANRKSTKRTYVDKDAVESMEVVTPNPSKVVTPSETPVPKPARTYDDVASGSTRSPTIEQLLEQKEKARGVKKQKLFEYDDEW